jgi:hypothetical protein
MRLSARHLAASTILFIGFPAVAQAGMPAITLSDVARMRVQTISFFLVALLLSAWFIQLLWNRLHLDFPALPRLGYRSAVGVVVLWGLLFVLVLTMISGARELMTPGAWEKQGATYRLVDKPAAPVAEASLDRVRRDKLEALRFALWDYARTHEGQLPPDRSTPEIPEERWQLPDASGLRYLYVGGHAAGKGTRLLAYEPELYGPERLVLLTNGDIRLMPFEEIAQIALAEKPQ